MKSPRFGFPSYWRSCYRLWVLLFAGGGKAGLLHIDSQSSGEVAITDTGSGLQVMVKQVRCTLITSRLEKWLLPALGLVCRRW